MQSQNSDHRDLARLLAGLETLHVEGPAAGAVRRLAYDSRQILAASLFVAIPGERLDGRRFVPEAIREGAVAVVYQAADREIARSLAAGWREAAAAGADRLTFVAVKDARRALAHLAVRFFDRPPDEPQLWVVSGPAGTRTLAAMLHAALGQLGIRAGLVDGMRLMIGGETRYATRNHPEAPEIEAILSSFRDAGARRAVLSFAPGDLAHARAAGLVPEATLLTGPVAAAAELAAAGDWVQTAVSHTHVTAAGRVAAELRAADLELLRVDGRPGTGFACTIDGCSQRLELGLPTRFMVANCLQLLLVFRLAGLPTRPLLPWLRTLTLPGHLEMVPNDLGCDLYIDHAWTAAELETLLVELRPHCRGRLVVVAGAGGDRSARPRRLLGRTAARLADVAVLTSSNPRSEGADAIVRDLLAQTGGGRATVLGIADRVEAIRCAVGLLEPGDLLLLAGKGDESFRMHATATEAYSDRAVLETALARRSAGAQADGERGCR
ncbi:MAG: Mur ligase domain-containing protein [Bacillota bacterium]|nr:Mur ligase domain-containing protein [Bacillota bacterium]